MISGATSWASIPQSSLRRAANVGIGFAVPIDLIQGVLEQLMEHGEVQRGQLGVMIQDVTPDLAAALQLKSAAGAVVSQVVSDSPAEEAGIEVGDVIVAMDGAPSLAAPI